MSDKKHEYIKAEPIDKCDNCGNTDAEKYWDYEDGSVLCGKCHEEIGDEWEDREHEEDLETEKVETEKDLEIEESDDEDEEVVEEKPKSHKKKKSAYKVEKKSDINAYIIGGAVFVIVLVLIFSARSLIAGSSSGGQDYTTAQTQTNLAALGNSGNGAQTGVATNSGNVQNAKLALVDFSYKLTPNKIKIGVPVRVEVDASTLSGCMTTVVIKDFGVRKKITSSDNIIEFTPDKTGTFWITCSMGMGPGSFEVVNSDGTSNTQAATQAASPPAGGGSCGAGGGGCGCGG